ALVARAARGGGEYDVSDADIQAFYDETISGSGGDPPKGSITAELIVKHFHGVWDDKGTFTRYSGQWKGPPPGGIGKRDIAVGIAGLKEQMKLGKHVVKGGPGNGGPTPEKVKDDGKGWVWLAADMSPGGLAVQLYTSVPYGKRPLLVAKRSEVDTMFEKDRSRMRERSGGGRKGQEWEGERDWEKDRSRMRGGRGRGSVWWGKSRDVFFFFCFLCVCVCFFFWGGGPKGKIGIKCCTHIISLSFARTFDQFPWLALRGSVLRELGLTAGLAAMWPPSPPRRRLVAARCLGLTAGLAAMWPFWDPVVGILDRLGPVFGPVSERWKLHKARTSKCCNNSL
ncbi:unnamed protein product, partial [Prorocentrum cordatum]